MEPPPQIKNVFYIYSWDPPQIKIVFPFIPVRPTKFPKVTKIFNTSHVSLWWGQEPCCPTKRKENKLCARTICAPFGGPKPVCARPPIRVQIGPAEMVSFEIGEMDGNVRIFKYWGGN